MMALERAISLVCVGFEGLFGPAPRPATILRVAGRTLP